MHDALFMRGFQRFADVPGNMESFFGRNRSTLNLLSQRLAFDQFEHQEARLVGFLQIIDGGDIWMIERRAHTLPTSTTWRNTSRSLDHTILSRVSRLLFLGPGISEADST